MIRVPSERAGKRKARELAHKFDAHYGVWRSEHQGEYVVCPVHAGFGLPGGTEHWELRYVAKPPGMFETMAREAMAVAIVAALLAAAIWWPA